MLSALLGHGLEAAAITIIVLFAVVLGFVQEYRAERAINALRKMTAPIAMVVRDGCEKDVPTRDLVPGDVIVLSTGDKVPADARLFQSFNLMAEEAPLTGESIHSAIGITVEVVGEDSEDSETNDDLMN